MNMEEQNQASRYINFIMDGRQVTCCDWAAPAIRKALAKPTLYEWAEAQCPREVFQGRGLAYGVALPAGAAGEETTPVVVRRNRHGGLLRLMTGECFLTPTRAPLELEISLRLRSSGIPTPEVISHAIYRCGGLFARSDVMTRRLPDGADFPEAWQNADPSAREKILDETAKLLAALAKAGAYHSDLNIKNIYVAGNNPEPKAYLLDVDRVVFPGGSNISGMNFRRLARSLNKWRKQRGLDFSEDSLLRLADLAGES
jgi:hypothetical protein